jgi:hypothetical protein
MLGVAPVLYTPAPIIADIGTPWLAVGFFALMAAAPRIVVWLLQSPKA